MLPSLYLRKATSLQTILGLSSYHTDQPKESSAALRPMFSYRIPLSFKESSSFPGKMDQRLLELHTIGKTGATNPTGME